MKSKAGSTLRFIDDSRYNTKIIKKELDYGIWISITRRVSMVYKYKDWVLYEKDVTLKDGRTRTIHFFTKRTPRSGAPCDLPDGYAVGVSERTGLPYLKIER